MSKETAWSSWNEWNYVKDLLTSTSFEDQLKGMEFLKMLRSRVRGGSLPISVELTNTLFVSKHKLDNATPGNKLDVCLCAAMAIIRFINGITDQFQTGAYAQAVQNITSKIGIPDWMVDLRHEATHGQLPSFNVLQSGVNFGLEWLFENYWEETTSKVEEEMSNFHKNSLEKIHNFSSLVFENIANALGKSTVEPKNEKKRSDKNESDRGALANAILKVLNHSNIEMFIGMLSQSGAFMLTNSVANEFDFSVKLFQEQDGSTALIKCFSTSWKLLLNKVQQKFSQFIEMSTKSLVNVYRENTNDYELTSLLVALFVCASASGAEKRILFHPVSNLLEFPSDFCFFLLNRLCRSKAFKSDFKKHLIAFIGTFEGKVQQPQNSINAVDWRECLSSTETCELFKNVIQDFQEAKGGWNDNATLNSEKQKMSRWRLLDSEELPVLQQMGVFNYKTHLTKKIITTGNNCRIVKIINTDFNGNTISYEQNSNSGGITQRSSNHELTCMIDNLFEDSQVCLVEDDSSGSDCDSCATEGYNEDVDMPWLQDGDDGEIYLSVETREKKFDGPDYTLKIPLDASAIDVSKVMLF